MKIPINEEIRKAHRQLSQYNIRFLEFAEKNPGSFKGSNYQKISSLGTHGWTDNLQPWPIFFDEDIKNKMGRVSINIFGLIKSIPKRIFSNSLVTMSEYFGYPMPMMQYFFCGLDSIHIPHLLGRGDFVFSPQGIKCIEFNITSGVEGWVDRLWVNQYLNNPIISKFLMENHLKVKSEDVLTILFNHLVDASLEELSYHRQHHQNELNMVITTSRYSIIRTPEFQPHYLYTNEIYQNALQQRSPSLKGHLAFSDFQHLAFNGEDVTYQGLKVHTIMDYSGEHVPLNLAAAAKNRKVLIFNGSSTGLLSNKLCLVILSENENSPLFTEDEKNTIKQHIPWTRRISDRESTYQGNRIDLKDFILSNREKLVLKPASGAGGAEVLLGDKTTENQWQEIVKTVMQPRANFWQNLEKKAVNQGFQELATELYKAALLHNYWVVQERQESFPYVFQSGENGCDVYHAVWGFFVFGSKYAGGFLRVLPKNDSKGIINTHQGARKTPIFEVEEVVE